MLFFIHFPFCSLLLHVFQFVLVPHSSLSSLYVRTIELSRKGIFLFSSQSSLHMFVFQTLSYFVLVEDVMSVSKSSLLMMDPQRKMSYVDEAFIEQKDVLLDMVSYQ